MDLDTLGAGRFGDQRARVLEHVAEQEIGFFELHAARLDLRQIEHIIDDRKQVIGGGIYLGQAIMLRLVKLGLLQQVGEADDGVHRRAYLVAHVGEKGALGLVRGVGALALRYQFSGAAGHHVFEVVAMGVEFSGDPLLLGDVFLDRHVMADVSIGLADRRDDGELDVFAAIGAAIVELALPGLSTIQRLPQRLIGLAWRSPGMQDARILADDLFTGIAGDPDKGFIDIFDTGLNVGDHDAVRALFHRQRELAQLVFGTRTLGNVVGQHDHGAAPRIVDPMRCDLDQDLASIAAPMAPDSLLGVGCHGFLD